MFHKTAYAIRNQAGRYLYVVKDRFGLDIVHDDSPERSLIWTDRKQAEDLLLSAEQHLGEKCELVEFELIEKTP